MVMQFVKFAIVGVSNTIINYSIYLFSLWILGLWRNVQRYDYLIAQIVAFLISVLWSYFWNCKYVFVQKKTDVKLIIKQLLKAYISYSVTGIFLSSILMFIEIDVYGMPKAIAPLVNIFIYVPINFLLNRYWTFKQEK